MRRVSIISAAVVCLAALPVPALAAQPIALGTGAVGAVDLLVDARPAQAAPIAPCVAGSRPENQTDPVDVGPSTSFGSARTTCTSAPDGTVHVDVSGQRFATNVLSRFGGPAIRARTFESSCDTTADGTSSGRIGLSGVSGLTVPQSVPANYTVFVPGIAPDTRPMAVVVLNEVTARVPSDGSLAITAMHITLFPQGGPASGEIVVGRAACAP